MTLTIDGNLLRDTHGDCYILHANEYWALLPDRTSWLPSEMTVREREFALLMRSAIAGEGLVTSMDVLVEEVEPRVFARASEVDAEVLLERIRHDEFGGKPSRLRCHFISLDRATAEFRKAELFRTPRALVRCHLVGEGAVHFADLRHLDRLEAKPFDEDRARAYWEAFVPENKDEQKYLEVLAERALYFPDWQTFPRLPDEVLTSWQISHR